MLERPPSCYTHPYDTGLCMLRRDTTNHPHMSEASASSNTATTSRMFVDLYAVCTRRLRGRTDRLDLSPVRITNKASSRRHLDSPDICETRFVPLRAHAATLTLARDRFCEVRWTSYSIVSKVYRNPRNVVIVTKFVQETSDDRPEAGEGGTADLDADFVTSTAPSMVGFRLVVLSACMACFLGSSGQRRALGKPILP